MADQQPQPTQAAAPQQSLKESSAQVPTASPPPYAPPPQNPLFHGIYQTFDNHPNTSIVHPVQPQVAYSSDGEEEGEGRSPIDIRVSSAVRVNSDHNLIVLAVQPAQTAGDIARAVVMAIKEASSANCGIPMIDEDGRPRPLRIEVDAGMDITGSGNILGPEAVVYEIVRQRAAREHQRAQHEAEEMTAWAKRSRSV